MKEIRENKNTQTLGKNISLSSSEIRKIFIDYFKKQGHTPVPSSSLIPENDPTLLFANAGMNQFKNVFLGLERRNYSRAVSAQKCVRAGGKHNDLENVGFTARHHTFFEMLGNFSFGDYFKKEAIHFAWELLTEHYKIPREKLYITVYETDDEAAELWHRQEGIPLNRIFRLSEKDNFWRMGDTGPCGPSTEIFFDHGPQAGGESDPLKGILRGEDRFVEIWNLVFMQFYEKFPGVMEPLPRPSVDTGSGLERLVAALQGRGNNYDTDLFQPLILRACEISGANYISDGEVLKKNPSAREQTAALRVLADHCRSAGFLIADGALPSNEGRGYVLRRILRRAIRFGHRLNPKKSILPGMIETLATQMGSVYPELSSRRELLLSTVKEEESKFLNTLEHGTEILNGELQKIKKQGESRLPGTMVFKLYDTFGFPADLTRLMSHEQGLDIDEAGFELEMEKARTQAKASWKGQGLSLDESHLISWSQKIKEKHGATKFVGYETLTSSAKVLALSDGHREVTRLAAGESGFLVLDQTPFYAEGGGQTGDRGQISKKINIFTTTQKNSIHLHHCEVSEGEISLGATVTAEVSVSDRRSTMANHSATHLMHAALRQVLGQHVSQAGSVVDPLRLRFDFTHGKALAPLEIEKIETLVNEQIALCLPVRAQVMSHKKALEAGAMALFGEKYGEEVRVLTMGNFSQELCGGTHVQNTSEIRLFKIISESGVSSGVRRIEALTSEPALRYLLAATKENLLARKSAGLPLGPSEILSEVNEKLNQHIENQKNKIQNLEKENKKLQSSKINLDEIVKTSMAFRSPKGIPGQLLTVALDLEDRGVLSEITDHLKNKIQSGIVVVVGHSEQNHPIVVSVTKNLSQEHRAGDLLKEIASVMGGKGGGRPDFAQGSAPLREKISEAFLKIQEKLKGN